MKIFRKILAGLIIIPALYFFASFAIGLLYAIVGAGVYGSQRAIGSLVFCVPLSFIAYALWPGKQKDGALSTSEFHLLPDGQSKADFIARVAASRLGVPREQFHLQLTSDLNVPARDVMDLWEALVDQFAIPLSENDFPAINSIEALRHCLSERFPM